MDIEIEMETPDDSTKTDIEIEMETPDDSLVQMDFERKFNSKSLLQEALTPFHLFNAFQPYVPSIYTDDADSDSEAVTSRESAECWLHSARYRTQPCKDGPSCSRRVCFFAHTPDQLRVLPQQSPWSTNSADSYDGSPLRHDTESSCAKTLPFVSSPGQCLPSWMIWSGRLRSSLNSIISIPGSIRNVFHPSSEDLADTPLEEVLSWKSFLCFALGSVLNVPPIYAECLIFLFICSLSYQANNLTSPFDIQFGTQSGKSTDTRRSLQRFKEAFHEFFPEMAHIMKFMTCYILTLMLIWPVRPGVQILCIVVLIFAPVFYFPELARKASGVDVACGSFKLPLIWFTSLGALGLSLICGFLILLVVYISWRFIHKGRPGVEGIQDEVVDSPETSVAMDMEASVVM